MSPSFIDKVRSLLLGEPARVISYSAVAIVWLVTHIGFALGVVETPPPAFDVVLAAVTGAIALLTEGIRMFTFSPATVTALIEKVTPPIANPSPAATGPDSSVAGPGPVADQLDGAVDEVPAG